MVLGKDTTILCLLVNTPKKLTGFSLYSFLSARAFHITSVYICGMSRLLLKLKNKYLLSVVLILVWLVFFDKNDVFTQYELIQKCHKLNAEREYYLREISNNKSELEDLKEDSKTLETFAREKYLMKKENEELFVFLTR